ncbi:alkene reductase [Jannaschia ovalis]|uniref:Alkene reductase n=1 Tax=Jannaschia ovalis TaxID=3038773 RepID=A0ABY8LBY1_9RHOB|nr:alkene reductase [Jannaschia sp. GRR-S6-38]WGH77555.1 alkene reductase [Jannaschia sp. GRR-S6-38]
MTDDNHAHPAYAASLPMGPITLENRVVMAPLTRSRSEVPGNLQTPLHALYYSQRAGAGLIVSEATQISQEGQGYAWTPGIHSDEQVERWKLVTDAVHNAGGRIFCQLWHVGAISHNVFQPDGGAPVSASDWQPEGDAFVGDYHPDGPTVPHPKARGLRLDEIPRLIEDFRHATRQAVAAGFDGVELHAANGYLLDQFIRSSSNRRDDRYGDSVENRIRIVGEILDAIAQDIAPGRIGVRLSPSGGAGGSHDDDPLTTYTAAAQLCAGRGLAYLHVVRPNSHGGGDDATAEEIVPAMRGAFDGVFIVNGGFEIEEGARWLEAGRADAICFGRKFLANPDLPARIAAGGPYNEPDPDTFYGGGAEGYVDYPSLEKTEPPADAA